MKSLLIVTLCLCMAISLRAQKVSEESVPQMVKSGLPKSYVAKNVAWSKEDSNYEASFKKEGKEISLVIDASGKVIETETGMKKSELPEAIVKAISKDYTGYKIEEAAKIVDASGAVTYEAEVEKGAETLDLIFDASGKLLEKEEKKGRD